MAGEPLLSVQEALERLLAEFAPTPAETVGLAQAAGRVLAQPVVAPFGLPVFTNSSMDGFAVRAADVAAARREQPARLAVVGDIPAGQRPTASLAAGQAMRIMTGAVLPAGADAVVPVEDTDADWRQAGQAAPSEVAIFAPVAAGAYLRPAGQDVQAGEVALPAGSKLRPQDVGLLAMLGFGQVQVHRRPRVALFSTGSELTQPGEPLRDGQIYDSNSVMLAAMAAGAGAEPLWLGTALDEPDAVRALLNQALEVGADTILSSAGVSVGAYDFVRSVVLERGELNFWRVNMRPGKPLAFGRYASLPFIGLPGNPVSAFVGFEVFVRPVLARLGGLPGAVRQRRQVRLAEPVQSDGRESYLRATLSPDGRGGWLAHLTGHQGSGNLRSLVQANAFIIIASEVKSLPIDAEVTAWVFDEALPGN